MQNKALVIGSIFLLLLILMAIFGPYLPFVDSTLEVTRYTYDDNNKLVTAPLPPSAEHPIGTDRNGRDLLSLLIIGTRETLLLLLGIGVIRYLLGFPLGVISALFPSDRIDKLLKGLHSFFSGIPVLFSAILLLSLPFIFRSEHILLYIVLIAAFVEAGRVAYIFQQHTIRISRAEHIDSGIMVGNSVWGLFVRYYWRNLLPQLITNFFLDLGRIMVLLGQLGFMSIFYSKVTFDFAQISWTVEDVSHSWPAILAESRNYLRSKIWLPFWTIVPITYTIITCNLFGEGLRQHFEEKTIKYSPRLEKKVMAEIKNNKQQLKLNRRSVSQTNL